MSRVSVVRIKGSMNKTTAVHVCFNFLYISLPSSAKQQREMIKFCGVYETWATPAKFLYLYVAVARF